MILRNGGGSSKNEIFGYEKETHAFTRGWLGESDGHLLDGAAPEGVALPLSGEQPQLLLLVFAQAVAVAGGQEICENRKGARR